jgi:hypothetical protein
MRRQNAIESLPHPRAELGPLQECLKNTNAISSEAAPRWGSANDQFRMAWNDCDAEPGQPAANPVQAISHPSAKHASYLKKCQQKQRPGQMSGPLADQGVRDVPEA